MIAINYYTEWIYIDQDIASRGAHNSTEDSYRLLKISITS